MAEVNIDIEPATHARPAAVRSEDGPFRIAILGDFSGRANRDRSGATSASRKAIEIDPDNFEEVMERMGVELNLSAGDVQLAMRFRELDDFHPDHLYRSLPLFKAFSEARKELAKVRPTAPVAPPAPEPPRAPDPPPPAPAAPAPGGSLLDMIAEQSASSSSSAPPASSREAMRPARPKVTDESAWDDAIRGIVAKHTIPKADPRQQSVIAQLDESAAAAMRAILSHPDFQALEAAWRSVFLLFRQVDTGVDLKVYLIDIARGELSADAVRRLLVDEAAGTPGEAPWSAIIGLYTFSPSDRDCALLAQLASVARHAGAPFLSAVHPRLCGCESIAETPDPDDWKWPRAEDLRTWQQLRASADARWLGLAMPCFLLRVPYGAKTSPIDSFDFEEMPAHTPAHTRPRHESYLWGNPAIICACLLGVAFNRDGWDLRPGSVSRIGGVAIHSYAPGEVTPPAEIWITERVAERILDHGAMPLASVKHSDEVLLVRFQSIADPPCAIAGPW